MEFFWPLFQQNTGEIFLMKYRKTSITFI